MRELMRKALKHPFWLGVTGVCTVATLVLTYHMAFPDKPPTPVTTPATSPPSSNTVTGDGNCSAQGSNNSVTCNALPKQIGAIKLQADTAHALWVFDGKPEDLPVPPDYAPEDATYHCPSWLDWMMTQPNFHATYAGGDILAQAGLADQVSIINAQVIVQSRTALSRPLTYVQCNHGAGGNMGYEIRLDTRTKSATLLDHTKGEGGTPQSAPMPPASVQMDSNTASDIVLTVESEENYLYSGRIIITAVINGEKRQLSIGSPQNPYRWINMPESVENNVPFEDRWDWDASRRQWVRGYTGY